MKLITLAVLAATALAGTSAVGAQSTANASGIRLTLTDLDPADGITPAVVGNGVHSSVAIDLDGVAPPPPLIADGFLTPLALASPGNITDASATAAILADSGSGASISVTAFAQDSGHATVYGISGGTFDVTPETKLTLSVDFSFSGDSDTSSEFGTTCMASCAEYDNGFGSNSLVVTRTFINDTDHSESVLMIVGTTAVVSGIPEPAPGEQLLLGLGLAGIGAWRHRGPRKDRGVAK